MKNTFRDIELKHKKQQELLDEAIKNAKNNPISLLKDLVNGKFDFLNEEN